MLKAIFVIALIFIVSLGSQLSAQELSTTVYTSEEELYEALRLGEINYEQFQILIELITHGIDISESYLYDLIPNQLHIDNANKNDSTHLTPLQTEQTDAFVQPSHGKFSPKLTTSYRYLQEMRQPDQHSYRLTTKLKLNRHWSTAFQLSRNIDGQNRVVSRSVKYKNDTGLLKKLTLGSFNTRLGLGTIYGYRGNIFNVTGNLGFESLRNPAYGGFNGLQAIFEQGDFGLELVSTFARDSSSSDTVHSLRSVGGMLSLNNKRLTPALIAGLSSLKNRTTGEIANDLKVGLYLKEQHEGGLFSIEITEQVNSNRSAFAFVFEGSQQFKGAKIKYAGWSYGDQFLNLTSGSKTASLSHRVEEEQTNFTLSDKLSGQRGGLLKSILQLADRWEMTSSLIIGDRSHDRSLVELLSSLRRIWSKSLSLRADFSSRRRQSTGGSADIKNEQRSRLELRFNLGEVKLRTYIAYSARDQATGFWSLFGRVRLPVKNLGRVEFSSNVGRIVSGKIEYWYLYLKHDQELSNRMRMTIKLSDSYDNRRAVKHEPVMVFELKVAI